MEQILKDGGHVVFTITGNSMAPMLYHRQDRVRLVKPSVLPLKKYDIPLFVRDDGRYILHRIVGMGPQGYKIMGDNQTFIEYPVADAQIIGVVDGFWRKEKYISCDQLGYCLYCRLWLLLYPVRLFCAKTRYWLARIKNLFRRSSG